MRLKPTQTRVRKRDGTISLETRVSDGFDAQLLTHETELPQYVQDQEAGLSRLDPRLFDVTAQRWTCMPRSPTVEDNSRVLRTGRLRLLTYNVWFSPHRQRERAGALFKILEAADADIICLQEVTPKFLHWLRDQNWVRNGFLLSDSTCTTLRGSHLVYGVVMLIKRDLYVSSLHLHALPTTMNRAALVATLLLDGHELRIATAHLESLDNEALRSRQIEFICRTLLASDSSAEDGASIENACGSQKMHTAAILAGDMNFDEGSCEDDIALDARFSDCWHQARQKDGKEGHATESGITMPCDDATNVPSRIDRVFLGPRSSRGGSKWHLVPEVMHRLGMDPVGERKGHRNLAMLCYPARVPSSTDSDSGTDPDMPTLIPVSELPWNGRPSDHYGLFCDFQVVSAV